jgi:DNA-binding transcriptional LysR family regulator
MIVAEYALIALSCRSARGHVAAQRAQRIRPHTPCADASGIFGKNPEVSIDLVLSDRLVDLIDERFDIAISSSPLTQANLTKRELAPLEWVICASPAYLKRVKTPKNPDDLRQHNCIFYASDAVPGDVWTFSRKGETKLVRINGNFARTTARRCAMWRHVALVLRCCRHSSFGRTPNQAPSFGFCRTGFQMERSGRALPPTISAAARLRRRSGL